VRLVLALGCAATTPLAARPGWAQGRAAQAIVIPEAVKVGDNRYRSPKDFRDTLKFYETAYKGTRGIVWHDVATPPQVKAKTIENTDPRSLWEAINIYEAKGEVRVFVLPRPPPPKGSEAAGTESSASGGGSGGTRKPSKKNAKGQR
jgi:hypothetical protein